jgi:hypothetical protein
VTWKYSTRSTTAINDEFTAFGSAATTPRRTKIYVPIDSAVIAKDLGVDPDIVFGRLHYHLEHLYAYTDAEDDSKVHLFTSEIEEGRWCVNVPYVASVLAVLRYEHGKYFVALWFSAIALVLSGIALFVSK